jgi:tetratricopeptide (TPR) repeat protein
VKKGLRIAAALALALSLGETPGAAQTAASSQPEAHTPAEEEALQLLSDGMMVSARSHAEEVLRASPNSIVGHYVLGRALFDAEGSLARAMFHLGRAREIYETTEMRGGAGSAFHQELLYQIARLAGQMELYEYQLEVLGYYDHLYDPDLVAERCWPLMKLGRQAEARQFAEVAVRSPNAWQRSAGLNALCALEGEARTRAPYHAACLASLEDARRDAARATDEETAGIAVDAYNAALAGTAALLFTDAEQHALEGVRRFEATGADPWQLLVELYVSEGRMNDALEAFVQMMRWNDRQPASLRDQGRAETEAIVAIVLLHAGETARALERIDRALARPDRRGLTTDGAEQARGRHALLRRIVRRTLEEERAEEASWRGLGAQLVGAVASFPRSFATFPDDERVVAVLADEDRLVSTVRPYVSGGIAGLSPWTAGELVHVLGPAVVAVALQGARALDASEPNAAAYYDAIEAEIAWSRGDSARALQLATSAMSRLEIGGWALVRARLAAIGADAAEDEGNEARAAELYATAMEIDPGVMRRLRLRLPVAITSTGGDADEAAALLGRSPRFRSASGAFTLAVTREGPALRACLRSPNGTELRCAEATPPPPPAPPGTDAPAATEPPELADLTLPQRLAREVHRQLFSARIELSRIDLTSLDGRPIGGSEMARERLEELMQTQEE